MSNIVFSETSFCQYIEWQQEDKKTLKRINSLLKSISSDGPMKGTGKPEKLKYLNNAYSRRIDEKNRLIYEIDKESIVIKSCKGHYED